MAKKQSFQGKRNMEKPEVRLGQWRPPGTGDCRAGEGKKQRSMVWGQLDVEGVRERTRLSRKKT